MKYLKTQVIALTIIGASLFSSALLAHGTNLKFSNDTNVDLSVRINNACSNQFGVIKRHSEKVISKKSLEEACKYDQSKCSMQVFNTAHCAGKQIETVVINTSQGVISLEGGETQSDYYYWRGDGFNLYVSNH